MYNIYICIQQKERQGTILQAAKPKHCCNSTPTEAGITRTWHLANLPPACSRKHKSRGLDSIPGDSPGTVVEFNYIRNIPQFLV